MADDDAPTRDDPLHGGPPPGGVHSGAPTRGPAERGDESSPTEAWTAPDAGRAAAHLPEAVESNLI